MNTDTNTQTGGRIRCLQINTSRMRDSHDIVEMIISEPNKTLAKSKLWHYDEEIDATLVIRNEKIKVTSKGC